MGTDRSPLVTAEEWAEISSSLKLSSRESEIVHQLVLGSAELAIASDLGCSPSTVRTHLDRIYRKLGLHCRSELLLRAWRLHAATLRIRIAPIDAFSGERPRNGGLADRNK